MRPTAAPQPQLVDARPLPDAQSQPEDTAHGGLRLVVETMTRLEQQAQASRSLIRQLADTLEQQTETLGRCRAMLRQLAQQSDPHAPRDIAPATAVNVRIYCFGPLTAYRGQEAIPLRRAGKASAIVKFLALRPHHPVQRDVLLEAIWPQTQPAVANNRLKVAMHHLRQAFVTKDCNPRCEGCVLFRDGCYLFNPDINVWTDIEQFEKSWQTGVGLERAGQLIQAIPHYLQAESLYRGDLLEEDAFEEWTLIRREELKDTYLTILDKLSNYWLQIGNLDDAIEGWKKILAKDPWREDIYRRLMECNARRGQRGLALRWYEICAQALQTQLNLGPEPETVALHQRILAGEDISDSSQTLGVLSAP
ncbi:MAG: winged helix-turn-helix domain-containing protein [Chloroflexi bacterium]|nr:winged helix-turn-helix domain-containing protein [Chloroflexota bacterium]